MLPVEPAADAWGGQLGPANQTRPPRNSASSTRSTLRVTAAWVGAGARAYQAEPGRTSNRKGSRASPWSRCHSGGCLASRASITRASTSPSPCTDHWCQRAALSTGSMSSSFLARLSRRGCRRSLRLSSSRILSRPQTRVRTDSGYSAQILDDAGVSAAVKAHVLSSFPPFVHQEEMSSISSRYSVFKRRMASATADSYCLE